MSSDDPRFDESIHASDEPTEKERPHNDAGAWFRLERGEKVRCLDADDYTDSYYGYHDRCYMCWRNLRHTARLHKDMVERNASDEHA